MGGSAGVSELARNDGSLRNWVECMISLLVAKK
jgi:hypothetical protein